MELDCIYNETNLETLARMPEGFLNCVVTSPPYFGLRDYGTATWEGGDAECEHNQIQDLVKADVRRKERQKVRDDAAGIYALGSSWTGRDVTVRASCTCKCGAVRIDQQIGLETTPAEYVVKMVEVFEEIRRALRPDGTVWLNLGDSYNGSGGAGGDYAAGGQKEGQPKYPGRNIADLKAKDLMGMPWRVAFALQAAGWYLRQDIIWAKPNPMPESVTDRCTKAHEYIFLLTKSARYFYDAEAVKEGRLSNHDAGSFRGGAYTYGIDNGTLGFRRTFGDRIIDLEIGRNKRSVWTVSTLPYSEAHFATFPPKLIEPCILAGCPAGGVVYDPFMGAGTTALVAHKLGRHFIGSEINPGYVAMANKRLAPHLNQGGLF